jgi:hypothetical protein
MPVKFSADIEGKKTKKILSIFLVFTLLVVNFFGFSINTARSADAWYSGGASWVYRVKVTINNSQIPSTQTNFPVYVNLENLPAVFWSNVRSDGGDIRVTNSSGTELAREVVSINTNTSTGELWFKADSISDASYYYIYYGNSGETEPAANSTYGSQKVWDDGGSNYFKGVWHLPSSLSLKYQTPIGGIPTASSYYFSRPPSMGFDGITGTVENGWVNNGGTSGSLTYKFSSSTSVTGYKVFPFILPNNNLSRTPKNWTFEGSNNGTTWTTLDTQTNQTSWSSEAGVTYAFSNSTSYLYYRLNCSVNNGDGYTAIGELQLNYLDNSIASLLDSTSNAKNLTNYGAGATFGRMIGGASFNSSSQWISVPSVSLGTVHTASAWVRPNSQTGSYNFGPVLGNSTGTNIDPISISGATDNNITYTQGGGGVGVNVNSMTGAWHLITSVRNGLAVTLYYDGVEIANGNLLTDEALTVGSIGSRNQPGGLFYNGVVDEVHLSSALRSADWIKAEYNNQNSPASFYSISAGEVPNNPTNLNSTASDLQVSLTWDAPSYEGTAPITNYIIEYKRHIDSVWTQFGHVASTLTSIDVAGVGLVNGVTYDFRVSAVSAVGVSSPSPEVSSMPSTLPRAPIISMVTSANTSVSVAFTPMSPAVSTPWYNNNWTYRKKITIDKTKVPNTNQSNFPVLVSLTGLSNVNANGTDVRFTSFDGVTELAREVESYSSTTLVAWVKVPTLSSSVDTDIYIYYGNSGAAEPAANSTYGSQKVWDDGGSNYFKGVWHLKETGSNPQVFDSTSGSRNSTSQAWTPTTGKIDGAGQFSGTSVAVTPFSLGVLHTSSAWVKPSQQTGMAAFGGILNGGGNSVGPLFVESLESTRIGYSIGAGGVAYDVPSMIGEWHHIVSVRDGVSVKLYYDGNEVVTGNLPANDEANISEIAARIGPESLYYRGMLDEVHVSTALRSADWIKTEYNNQSDPDSFYAVASEENFEDATADGGSLVTGYTVTSFPEGITATGSTSPIIVTGLTNGTPYTFTIVATNSVGDSPSSIASDSVIPATVPGEPTAVLPTYGNNQVSLFWSAPASDGGSNIIDYIIEYKLTNDLDTPANWQISADPETPTIVPTLVTGLVNGLSYDFRITARNAAGNGSSSSPLVSSVPKTIPGKPIITSTVSGDMQAIVNFTPLTTEENIDTSATNGGSEITNYTITSNPESIVVSSSTSPIIITGLTNGTSYTFTMTATNMVGQGPASNVSSPVIPAGIPEIPTELVATPGNALIDLSWTAPYNNGAEITNYVIEYKLRSDENWIQVGHAVSPLTTITITDLVNGSLYDFRVSAYNSAGTSEMSSPLVSGTPRTIPGQPVITNVERGDGQVIVNFTAPVSNGGSEITNYTITSDPQGIVQTGSTSPIIIGGLTNGTPYTFTVKATNVVGDGPVSTSSVSVIPAGVPGKATGVTAVAGNGQATITFVEPLSDGGSTITGYTVYSNNGGTDSNASSTNLSHVVTGLANGTTYTFTVVAQNNVGNGLASDASVPITLPTVPTIPLNIAAEVKSSSVKLTWSDPASTGGSAITDYIIEYKLTTGGDWVPFDDEIGIDKFVTVTGLSNGTSYDFRVSAKNIVGTSEVSSFVSATPGEPAQVRIMGFPDLTNTSIGTDIKITNEGLIEYEYQYTWCVTIAADNLCGGGDDVFSASNAKLIEPGHDFDFIATSTVSTPGDYFFHIKVLYGSASSTSFSSFAAVATFPDPPTSVSAVAGNADATISFTIPASNGGSPITNYTVTSNPGGLIGNGVNTPIVVTGLTNGTAYTFTMSATNIVGTGLSSSPPTSPVTPVTVPDIVSSLSASAGDTQVGLFWSSPFSDGGSPITDYIIEYKLSSDISWSIFADPVSVVTTATVTGLTNNLSYDFRIKAVNSVGQGPINSVPTTFSPKNVPTVAQTNTGSRSSSGSQIYQQVTTSAGTTTLNTKNIPAIDSNTTPLTKTTPSTTPKTKPNINEVTATPKENSHITEPVMQKQISVENLDENKTSGVPWIWIITSSLLTIIFGLIVFIIRRRLMVNPFN